MQTLSDAGRRVLDDLAARHGIGAEAAETLLRALAAGGGTQAQFNHPGLGGMGQWSAGGMIMIGDMFNNGLKYRIDTFLTELASAFAAVDMFAPVTSVARDGREGVGLFAPGFGYQSAAWPEGLGRPSSSGAQNDLHYAYFPDSRRLAIRQGGHITLYDTADHSIGGVSQQQSGDRSLSFTSQHGTVHLADLKVVADSAAGTAAAPRQAEEPPATTGPEPEAPTVAPAAAVEIDIIAMIEKLAMLRDRGILSETEFAAKKAELLGRL